MPEIVRLQPEDTGTDKKMPYLPPTFNLKFTQDEFPAFLANPAGTMRELGEPVANLTVTVTDHVWHAEEGRWITDQDDPAVRELPGAATWQWMCGYSDEQCVCERVIVP
jgi:hypothetical protein